jgi:hypothetical protein
MRAKPKFQFVDLHRLCDCTLALTGPAGSYNVNGLECEVLSRRLTAESDTTLVCFESRGFAWVNTKNLDLIHDTKSATAQIVYSLGGKMRQWSIGCLAREWPNDVAEHFHKVTSYQVDSIRMIPD